MNAAAADVAVRDEERRLDPQTVERVAAEPVSTSRPWAKTYVAEALLWSVTLGAASVAVLVALRSYADRRGVCWPSHEALAARSGLSEAQVRSYLKRARAAGLVEWSPRRTGKSGRPVNCYRLPNPEEYPRRTAETQAEVSAAGKRLNRGLQRKPHGEFPRSTSDELKTKEPTHSARGGGALLSQPRTDEEEAAEIVRFHRELVGRETGGGLAARRHVEKLLAEDGATPAALRLALVGAAMDDFVLGENDHGTDHMLNLAFILAQPDASARRSWPQRAERARRWGQAGHRGLSQPVQSYWSREWRCGHEEVFERFRRERDAVLAAEQPAVERVAEQPAEPAPVDPFEPPQEQPPAAVEPRKWTPGEKLAAELDELFPLEAAG